MDKGELIIAPAALDDLSHIWLYLAVNASNIIADRVLDELYDRFQLLSMASRMGKARPELAANLRSTALDPFVIFYRPTFHGAEIVRIVRAEQDIEHIAQVGGLE